MPGTLTGKMDSLMSNDGKGGAGLYVDKKELSFLFEGSNGTHAENGASQMQKRIFDDFNRDVQGAMPRARGHRGHHAMKAEFGIPDGLKQQIPGSGLTEAATRQSHKIRKYGFADYRVGG